MWNNTRHLSRINEFCGWAQSHPARCDPVGSPCKNWERAKLPLMPMGLDGPAPLSCACEPAPALVYWSWDVSTAPRPQAASFGKLWTQAGEALMSLHLCLSFCAASSSWRSLGSATFSKCSSWNLLQGWMEHLVRTGQNGSFEEKDNAKLISMASGFSGYGYIKMYLNTGIKWELHAPSAVVQ